MGLILAKFPIFEVSFLGRVPRAVYIYTAIYASQPLITNKRDFFEHQSCLYEMLDGTDGRVDWRDALKTKLKHYLERFPDCIKHDQGFRKTEAVLRRVRRGG